MTRHLMAALGTLALAGAVRAAIVVPGANGTDEALNITANTVIDLSQAVTGQWDNDNSANAGKGVYDPAKWAVVFKYTEVNIAAGATVTFKNHASRAPVVWLVSGDVKISGSVQLSGQDALPAPLLPEPGPGGFRGGQARYVEGVIEGSGFGPGGGKRPPNNDSVSGEDFASRPVGEYVYGNPSNLPLIGGSGGGGGIVGGGGAGGGAMLVAAAGNIVLHGSVEANGGRGGEGRWRVYNGASGGSGGAIRLVCNTLSGRGSVHATGQTQDNALLPGKPGGVGRIRVERVQHIDLNPGAVVFAPDPSTVTLTSGTAALVWPPAGAPEVRITSIGSQPVGLDPRAGFGASGPDVALPMTNETFVTIETRNVESASQVIVRLTPRADANYVEARATVDSIVSTDPLVIRWKADLPVNVGYSAVQARVIRP